MTTEFVLIRHCEGWTHSDAAGSQAVQGLTSRGVAQAQALAAYLVQEVARLGTVTALYSSPLLRCLETATPIAQALRLTTSLAPQLRPGRVDVFEPERIGRFLTQLCEAHRGGRVVVIGHAVTLAAASSVFQGLTTGSGGLALATLGHGWLSRWQREEQLSDRTETWMLTQHCDLQQLRLDFSTPTARLPLVESAPIGDRWRRRDGAQLDHNLRGHRAASTRPD